MTEPYTDTADISDQDAADGGYHRGDTPAHGKYPFDRNPHALGSRLMIGNGPHEYAGAGILEKDRKKGEQHQGYAHAPQVQIGNLYSPEIEGLLGKNIELANIIAPQHDNHAPQDVSQTQGHHDNGYDRLPDQGPQHQPFNNQAQEDRKDHGDEKRSKKIEPEIQRHRQADVGTHHHKFALGQVENRCGFINQDKPQGHQGVNGAHGQACYKKLHKKRKFVWHLNPSFKLRPETLLFEQILVSVCGFHGTHNEICAQGGRLAVLVANNRFNGKFCRIAV